MRSTSIIAAALALVALSAREAAAQAPTVTWSQSGPTLTINWTAVPGATLYDVAVTGTLNAQASIPTNFLVVAPPPGTYVFQVRGRNGGTVGPLSDPVTIQVTSGTPLPGCLPMTPPTLTAATSGNVLTLTIGAVPGAIGFRVQLGTTPGATQFSVDIGANQLTYSAPVPAVGTFYGRVIAANACGTTMSSNEVTFTVGTSTPGPGNPTPGAGPREPDPPAGQLLPVPGYLPAVVQAVAAAYPGDLRNSCREEGGNNTFMFRVLSELRKRSTRWGNNDKRGWPNDLSQDIVTYNPTNQPDQYNSRVYLFDIIGGHCGGNPGPNWADVTDATWSQRGNPACGSEWCARWTIDRYLQAGFQP